MTPKASAAPPIGATMRTMTEEEIDAFVSQQAFGVLSLAEHGSAYGVPLFYGAQSGNVYFQTRVGAKSPYLYATTEACLTIAMARGFGDWASVQLMGRLERVGVGLGSAAERAIVHVPPPLPWNVDDARGGENADGALTTFRLVPTRRVGRYSQRAAESILDVAKNSWM